MQKSKILIIEDCHVTRESLTDLLKRDYEVENVGDAESALIRVNQVMFDLLIVDICLPAMDGFKFCVSLRAQNTVKTVPIIIFSGRNDIEDKLVGFALGACDYVSKPVDLRELRARIQIQLGQKAASDPNPKQLAVGPFDVNPQNQSISFWFEGVKVELEPSPLEYRLMHFFMTHIGQLLTRAQLLDQVWGTSRFVNDRSVDAVISKLRQKMGPHADLIQSIRGAGYRFCTPEPASKKSC